MDDLTARGARIRLEAYLIWLGEGGPEGRDNESWDEAERIVDRIDEARREDENGVSPAIEPSLARSHRQHVPSQKPAA